MRYLELLVKIHVSPQQASMCGDIITYHITQTTIYKRNDVGNNIEITAKGRSYLY